ncbi:MAG: type 4a pilus biogenesis protein PilO [Candidatus Omnitrophota bacterium]
MKNLDSDGIIIIKPRLIIAAAALIIFLAGCLIVYLPLMRELKVRMAEYTAVEYSLADSRRLIKSFEKSGVNFILPTEKERAVTIEELTGRGKELGVKFNSIKPGDVMKSEFEQYEILPVEMDLEATDKQFAGFLGSLDSLKKNLIKVESFSVIPDERDRTRLKARIAAYVYFSKTDTSK